VIQTLTLAQLRPAPWNPRPALSAKDVELQELGKSIEEHGVLQPLLVRAIDDPLGSDTLPQFEIVSGHRRAVGAQLAGLEEVPVIVRELDDAEAIAVGLTENLTHLDLHPIYEAEALRKLRDDHDKSVEEIAARLCKSPSYIRKRLSLCTLTTRGKKACIAGKLTPAIATLVCRLPVPKLQNAMIEEIISAAEYEPYSYAQAKDLVEEDYMLRLDTAPFDTADAELVAKAGPCTTCPHRTGNQAELFDDVGSKDLCVNPPCFTKKKDADWKAKAQAAKQTGQKVLEGDAAAKALTYSSAYTKLDDPNQNDPKRRTYRQLLGKDAPVPVLVRDARGGAVEVVPTKVATKLIKDQHKWARDKGASAAETGKAEAAKARHETKVHRLTAESALGALVVEVEKGGAVEIAALADFWRLLVGELVGLGHDTAKDVARRRGIDVPSQQTAAEVLRAEVTRMGEDRLAPLSVELICTHGLYSTWQSDRDRVLKKACELFGIDLEEHRREAKIAAKPKKKAPAKRAAKASSKRA
jgi:ParB/RepB/Spo0J family partition protein